MMQTKIPTVSQDNQDQQVVQSLETYNLCMAGVITIPNAMSCLWNNYTRARKLSDKIKIVNRIKFIQTQKSFN